MRWCSIATALALGLLLTACTGRPDGVEAVRGFDAARYMGTWYEIMRLDHRFERGLTNVTATYDLLPDGTVRVVNKGLDRASCTWESVEGTATFQDSADVASLSVTFFWPFAGGYHVFELDRDRYGHALVSGPSRDYFWMLARQPDLPETTRRTLVDLAAEVEFPVDELILVDHSPADCPPPAE